MTVEILITLIKAMFEVVVKAMPTATKKFENTYSLSDDEWIEIHKKTIYPFDRYEFVWYIDILPDNKFKLYVANLPDVEYPVHLVYHEVIGIRELYDFLSMIISKITPYASFRFIDMESNKMEQRFIYPEDVVKYISDKDNDEE